MKKTKLTKKDLTNVAKNLTSISENDVIPPEIMAMLEDKMPPWLKEYAAKGTGIVRATFEYTMLVTTILKMYFDFSDDDIAKFEKKIKTGLEEISKRKLIEGIDPIVLHEKDLMKILTIIDANTQAFKKQESRIKLPDKPKFIK